MEEQQASCRKGAVFGCRVVGAFQGRFSRGRELFLGRVFLLRVRVIAIFLL